MSLFASITEFVVFIIFLAGFLTVLGYTIAFLYSESFMQSHAILANRMFNPKRKKIGRVILFIIFAIIAHVVAWKMMETLLITYVVYHLVIHAFFHNKGFVNTSLKYEN